MKKIKSIVLALTFCLICTTASISVSAKTTEETQDSQLINFVMNHIEEIRKSTEAIAKDYPYVTVLKTSSDYYICSLTNKQFGSANDVPVAQNGTVSVNQDIAAKNGNFDYQSTDHKNFYENTLLSADILYANYDMHYANVNDNYDLVEDMIVKTFDAMEVEQDEDQTQAVEVTADIASQYTITLPKFIQVSSDTLTTTYNVSVTGELEGMKVLTVSPPNSMLLKQDGRDDINATITQDLSAFRASDLQKNNGTMSATGTITVAAKPKAGVWNGNFNFTINLATE